jgi:WD40 repeat protein
MDVACTPDGKMLVTGGRDKTTKIASAQTGELLRVLDTSTERIGTVAADGLFAISAGKARSLVAFELKIALDGIPAAGAPADNRPITSRAQYARDFEGQAGEVLALALSGDRKLVAAAGAFADVRVYQVATRQRIALIPNVPAPVYAVALDAKGTRLALGTKGGQIQIYELPAGKMVKSLVPVPVVAQGARP